MPQGKKLIQINLLCGYNGGIYSYKSGRCRLMQKRDLATYGIGFFTPDGIRTAVESAANSPRVAAGVATATAGLGAMAKLEMINSVAGTISLCAGAITACLVLIIQAIKIIRVWRTWDPNKIPPKELL
jgi:hypothetical protein